MSRPTWNWWAVHQRHFFIPVLLSLLFSFVAGTLNCGWRRQIWYYQTFNNFEYALGPKAMSFKDASIYCASQSSFLASIHSDTENSLINCMNTPRMIANDDSEGKWLGGFIDWDKKGPRKSKIRGFSWMDSSTFDYGITTKGVGRAPWLFERPRNARCIKFLGNGATAGWTDFSCENPNNGDNIAHVVCKRPGMNTTSSSVGSGVTTLASTISPSTTISTFTATPVWSTTTTVTVPAFVTSTTTATTMSTSIGNSSRREVIPVRRALNDDNNFIDFAAAHWAKAQREAIPRKNEWQAVLAAAPSYPINTFKGRGIIIIAGGVYLTPAMIVVKMLRQYGCTLRIQFWHLGAAEMALANSTFLAMHNVETQDLANYEDEKTLQPLTSNVGLRVFQLKPLALLHTDLEDVMLIDSDNCPIRDPTYLFDSPEYIRTGAVFWPDYWKTSLDNPIWNVIGKEPTSTWEQESGQLLLNKKQSWAPLHVCVHMNSAFYMELLNGDKDTFRFAWLAADAPFFMVPTWPATVGTAVNGTRFCGHTMLQHDLDGRPLFVHHNQLKQLHFPMGENFKYKRTVDTSALYKAVPSPGITVDGALIPCIDISSATTRLEDSALHEFEHQYMETEESV